MKFAVAGLLAMRVGLLLPLCASTGGLLTVHVKDMAINPDGRIAAIATDVSQGPYAVQIVSLEDGSTVSTIRGQGQFNADAYSVGFTPDGKTILIVDTFIRRMALPSLTPLPDLGLAAVGDASLSANGRYAMSCQGNDIDIWDLSEGKEVFDEFPELNGVSPGIIPSTCRISGDGEWVIASGEEEYCECHWRKGPCHKVKGAFEDAAFRPDGKAVALLVNLDPLSKSPSLVADRLTIQSLDNHTILRSEKAEDPRVSGSYFDRIVYSPDGRLLALGGIGLGIMKEKEGPVRRLFYSKEYPYIEHLQFTPDGKRIVFIMQRPNRVQDYKLGLWDLAANKLVWSVPVPRVPAEPHN